MLTFILLLLAAICFGLAAAGVTANRINLIALGLLFWVLPAVITAAH
jgi:hypothetical protein